ncbi:MAG TPA: dihydropyrimidinase [Trueperaceae bacterium]
MPLLVKNGEIVTADSRYFADIYCEGDTITRIGKDLEAPAGSEVVDASGKYVFPGFIDPHVHVYLPFMGTETKDNHTTASQAALVGGTTSIIEMAAPGPDIPATEGYALWKGKADGNSACDYTFHMGVTHFDDSTPDQLREVVEDGITSFKVFLAYKGALDVDDDALFRTLTLARELGVTVTAHCENAELVYRRQQMLLAQGNVGPGFHEKSRPARVEAEGTNHFATFLEMTGAKGYVVHLSCLPALEAAIDAKQRGVDITVEAVIPHLILDYTYAERPDFEGAKFVMSPPLRTPRDREALWRALEQGIVDTVGTDHAPFDFEGQKDMGKADFTKIPNGIPAIEDRVNMLYTYGVSRGNLDIHRFVDAASTRVARIFGLTQKGQIAVGKDADLVVYDPKYRGTLSDRPEYMNVDYRGFGGFEIDGRPSVVTVRGQVAVRDGEFVGDTSRGKLIRREPVKG